MDKMKVVGGPVLKGEVSVSGAKNAALPLIFSTLLAEGEHKLSNVPHLRDITSAIDLMASLGCEANFQNNQLRLRVNKDTGTLAHYDQVRKMRASILVLGPLLARFKKAKVSLPGGCAIGARPIEMHLDALEAMGAQITMEEGYVIATTDGLKGAEIEFPFPTVGGTENIMMAASLATGKTVLKNAACEPEIVDLAQYLQSMGVDIKGAGTPIIEIIGQDKLNPANHRVVADRIEAGTLLVAGAITGGEVKLNGAVAEHLEAFLKSLEAMGVEIDRGEDFISARRQGPLKATAVETAPFPGFPTDLQAQLMALMTQAEGESQVTEKVFENRFMHVSELSRLGAKIRVQGQTAIIEGVSPLKGAPVMATDLRASACLILAGLVGQGETVVNRIYHLDRGYENLETKLSNLGANVERITS